MRHTLISKAHYVNRRVNFGFFSAMLEKLGIRSYPWKSYRDHYYESMYLTFSHREIFLDVVAKDWEKLVAREIDEIPVTMYMSSADTEGFKYFFNAQQFLENCLKNQQGPVLYPFTRTSVFYSYEIRLGEMPQAKPIRNRDLDIEVVRNGKLIPTGVNLEDGTPALKFVGKITRECDWKFVFTI